jgi:penicillin-binding protein 2
MAAIANEGTLYKPHLVKYMADGNGNKTETQVMVLEDSIAKEEAFEITKEGMWSAVNGSGASIGSLSGLGTQVAAKTGTAEFGAMNIDGSYDIPCMGRWILSV